MLPARMRPAVALVALVTLLALVAVSCAHKEHAPESTAPVLDVSAVAALIPSKVNDRDGWAEDIVSAIHLVKKEPTAERVCAVVAVIEQESGFQADPAVADLPAIVRRGIAKKVERLGPLAGPTVDAILDSTGPDSDLTFRARIDKLHTERDLDRLFRDVTKAVVAKMPGVVALLSGGAIEDLNPVTTSGSMQVKVSFARSLEKNASDEDVRELLYTRAGGVRFGTARLIGYQAAYDDIRYRFADFNAGAYSSRNAAFQMMLGDLVGAQLVQDGDVLAYDKSGDVAEDSNTLKALLAFGAVHDLSSFRVHRDAKTEKTEAFEDTDSYKAVAAAWSEKMGTPAPYAKIPDVSLSSPKLSKPRTTAWYAASVKRRYDTCRALL
ncbi:MAG TPA: DUF1615 family protein [Myxococcota bacterium]